MLAGPHILSLRLGPHPQPRLLRVFARRNGSRLPLALTRRLEDSRLARAAGAIFCSRDPTFFHCGWGPTPSRGCSAPSRVATAQGCRSRSLGGSKTRASLGPQALSSARGTPHFFTAAGAPPPAAVAPRLRASQRLKAAARAHSAARRLAPRSGRRR